MSKTIRRNLLVYSEQTVTPFCSLLNNNVETQRRRFPPRCRRLWLHLRSLLFLLYVSLASNFLFYVLEAKNKTTVDQGCLKLTQVTYYKKILP